VFYVLLELQSKPDFTMPFRLLVYMVELMRRLFAKTAKKVRERKDFRLPAVVPIVLYNGADEWSYVRSFKEYLADYELFGPNLIDFEYIMINVNAPDEASLLNVPTLMNLAMFADRKGDPESILRRLRTAIKLSRQLPEDERSQLKDWILDVLLKKAKAKLSRKETSRIKKLFDNMEDADMTYALEGAIDEIERRGREDERIKAAVRLKAERKAAEAKLKAEREAAVNALRAAGVSEEIIETVYPNIANPTSSASKAPTVCEGE
jgi:hypothetical protein